MGSGRLPDLRAELEAVLLGSDRVGLARLRGKLEQLDDALAVVEGLVVPVLERIGAGWQRGDCALAQVYMSGLLCEELIDRLVPGGGLSRPGAPRVALAVLDDFHMLGKRLVYSVLRAAGYDVLDYGRMQPKPLVERVEADGVDVLLLSVLMLPSALRVREVVAALPLGVRVGVGGAPFRLDPGLAQEVGADAVGVTASDAIRIVRSFTEVAA